MHTEPMENPQVEIQGYYIKRNSTIKFLNLSHRKLFLNALLFTLSVGCMRDGRLNGRYMPLDSQPRDGVSQVNMQGLTRGCSSDSCKRNQCTPPFACVDLWRVHECRYEYPSSGNSPLLKRKILFFTQDKFCSLFAF